MICKQEGNTTQKNSDRPIFHNIRSSSIMWQQAFLGQSKVLYYHILTGARLLVWRLTKEVKNWSSQTLI